MLTRAEMFDQATDEWVRLMEAPEPANPAEAAALRLRWANLRSFMASLTAPAPARAVTLDPKYIRRDVPSPADPGRC